MGPERKRSEPKARLGPDGARTTAVAARHLIDERLGSLGDWRAEILAKVRRLIHEADPDIMEECKWAETLGGPTLDAS